MLLFPLLVVSLSQDCGVVARFLSSRVIYRLGVWSYAIYLVHFPLLEVAPALVSLLQAYGVHAAHTIGHGSMVAIVFFIAFLGHRLVEVPGRRILRSCFAAMPRGRAAASLQPFVLALQHPSLRLHRAGTFSRLWLK